MHGHVRKLEINEQLSSLKFEISSSSSSSSSSHPSHTIRGLRYLRQIFRTVVFWQAIV